ncbi:hypothetical protein E4K72_14280 [Oxalobacteraceae bacterium OM1]|nr:hypothetical protein E4K72_14280 [Oxalobacteraceae bacterium OM1]
MPDLTLEYTQNVDGIDLQHCLVALNAALLSLGCYEESELRARATTLERFAVGVAAEQEERGFVHALLAVPTGVSEADQRRSAETLLQCLIASLRDKATGHVQVCVDVVERRSQSERAHLL